MIKMELNLLNRLVFFFATLVYLRLVSGSAVDLQNEKFKACGLDSLLLSKFNIVQIECDGFTGVQNFTKFAPAGSKVTEITLRDSNITVFKDNLLYEMGTLELEKFHYILGNLEKIEDGAFKGGEKIKELDLTGNSIESLDPAVFRYLINLQRLHLDDNKLKQFAENAVIPNEKLRDLTLIGNKIEKLSEKLFSKVHDLGVLMLHDNQLKILEVTIFTKSCSNISLLSPYNNPWDCNCEFMEMIKVIEKKNIRLENEKRFQISCSYKGGSKFVYNKTNFRNLRNFCTESTKLNTTETNSKKMTQCNHLGFILVSFGLVIALAALAGIGFWIKKRTVMENGRVNFVTMTEDED